MTPLRVGPLVRAISPISAVVWAEFFQPGEVILSARPYDVPQSDTITTRTRTATVGGRHYAAPQLTGLQPGTWYTYAIETSANETEVGHVPAVLPHQCFRTLNFSEAGKHSRTTLRLAYGSCRDLREPQRDALSAFGSWLLDHFAERETAWPRLLLLIGDQIYADELAESFLQKYPHLRVGKHPCAQTFADFASLYEYTWTNDEQVRQLLAMLPTYMIFDDHEILNNWNLFPAWRARAIKRGREQILIDGLVAYWVYQGWGNLYERISSHDSLLQIMQDAAESGEDTLEALRTCMKAEVYGQTHLQWHYEIPTTPPICVMDVRADRPATFTSKSLVSETPARIMSKEQMRELGRWLSENKKGLAILVSSVPVLLPPLIGLAEYMMGIRPLYKGMRPLRWVGRQLARIQHKLAVGTSFDHWPVFAVTWHELVEMLKESPQDVLVLSGDVHFSYAMEAHVGRSIRKKSGGARLYQLVSTPLQNELSDSNRRLVLGQAWLRGARYGGLRVRMLPMVSRDKKQGGPRDLLLENVVAMVTVEVGDEGYEVRQEYLGLVDGQGKMDVVGETLIQ